VADDPRSGCPAILADFEAYCTQLTRSRLAVLDNARTHRGDAFEAKIKSWKQGWLYVLFLPPYSLKLNLIEIFWRKL